jgi:tripartite-type tricarboxylate transporter receptor subunit TctC
MDHRAMAFAKGAVALAALWASCSWGQAYPSKPVHIVVPGTAGAGNDLVTRIIAERLTRKWGTQVLVENRPGGGSTIGAAYVANAPADGYTLLVIPLDFYINAALFPKLPYDPVRDFAPISSIIASNMMIATHPSLGVKSVAQLVQRAKTNPGQKLAFASCGNGSPTQLVGVMLSQVAGIALTHVPYKGCAAAQVDVLSGEVPLLITGAGNIVSHVRAGRLVPLAVTASTRHPQLPEVPTLVESGFPDIDMTNWMGMLAPAKTPPEIISKIQAELATLFADQDFLIRVRARGFEPLPSTPEELRSRIDRDRKQFEALTKQLGAGVD